MPPNFIHVGVTLYSGFTGISGISFGGIIFGGMIKTGGLFEMGAGADLGKKAGAFDICGALYSPSWEIGETGVGGFISVEGNADAGAADGGPAKSPFMVLMMISSVCF